MRESFIEGISVPRTESTNTLLPETCRLAIELGNFRNHLMSSETNFNAQWIQICESARTFAATMAALNSARAATMIQTIVADFCNQKAPTNDAERDERSTQRSDLNGRISSISHVDTMSRMSPSTAEEMFKALDEYVIIPLARTDAELQQAHLSRSTLLSTISHLSSADTLRRLRQ